jgi:hypothetical protein
MKKPHFFTMATLAACLTGYGQASSYPPDPDGAGPIEGAGTNGGSSSSYFGRGAGLNANNLDNTFIG